MREIRRNLGIGIAGVAGTSRPLYRRAVHRPDRRRMRSERRRIGGAFQATIDPLYRQCARRGGPFVAASGPSTAGGAVLLSAGISLFVLAAPSDVYRLIARARLQPCLFCAGLKLAARCAVRAFGGPSVSPLIRVISCINTFFGN